MPSYFGKILPRTGPQFAFTDDFNDDDDEALKRLDKGLDTLNLRRWGACCVWGPGVQHGQRCQDNAGLSLVNTANTGR